MPANSFDKRDALALENEIPELFFYRRPRFKSLIIAIIFAVFMSQVTNMIMNLGHHVRYCLIATMPIYPIKHIFGRPVDAGLSVEKHSFFRYM